MERLPHTQSFSVHYIKGFMILTCLIIGDIYLDHLDRLASARFLHYKVLSFSLQLISNFRDTL